MIEVFSTTFFAETWQLRRMYSYWRFFLWPTQASVLFFGEWKHPLPRFRGERLRPGNHCHHLWLFHMEGKDYLLLSATIWYMLSCFLTRCYPSNVLRKHLQYPDVYQTFLPSSTLPKRTEATRALALAFHAGQSEITTTIPPRTCGCIVRTVATCTMEGN